MVGEYAAACFCGGVINSLKCFMRRLRLGSLQATVGCVQLYDFYNWKFWVFLFWAVKGSSIWRVNLMKYIFLMLFSSLCSDVHAEQNFTGKIKEIEVVNYLEGAAYLIFDGVSFNECPIPVTWCAIDFSLPAAREMYSAALAYKLSGKAINVTTNGCWYTNYPRCWKVNLAQ